MNQAQSRVQGFLRLIALFITSATMMMPLAACIDAREEPTAQGTVALQRISSRSISSTIREQAVLAPLSPANVSQSGPLTAADGYIPDGVMLTPFETNYPAVGNLQPDLLNAVQHAATDASPNGVTLLINSGWRSARYQQSLLNQAVQTYGSVTEARKWVNTPDKSTHVKGEAVDIGPANADLWLSQHGSAYGLCQTYSNEMWHFELSVEPDGQCPPQIGNASEGSVPGS